jgi:DNA-binding MarR family transcriptional regulator
MEAEARRAALAELYALPGHLLWRAAARVAGELDRMLPAGTDIHAYAVLLALAEEEPASQRRLAELIAVSGTTMSSVVHAMLTEGLVERVRNPDDRRSYALTRTSAGRDAVRRWGPHVERLETHLTAALTREQVTRLHAALRGVIGDQLHECTPPAVRASTGFLVSRAHQAAHRRFQAALRPLDIDPRQFGTLRAVGSAGPVTQNELGALLDVSPATVVQIVDDLEGAGLVARVPDPGDRRVHLVRLTAAAGPVVERARDLAAKGVDDVLGGPGSAPLHDLVELLPLLLTPPAGG